MRAPCLRLLLLACLSLSTACATYSDRMQTARQSASQGDYEGSIGEINKILDVKDSSELPEDWKSERALALLERATLQQARGEFESSSRDFQAADKQLEYLDFVGDAAGSIGKYVFSDDSDQYTASPTEKLALNAVNMMNYLARGDARGGRVEAKRFTVMRRYLDEFDGDNAHAAFGSYLAGFIHEKLGEFDSAIRYYDEALQERNLESLRGPVKHVAQFTNYRGKRIEAFLADVPAPNAAPGKTAEILVTVAIGRVPHKIPERIPIGAAVGMAGAFISGDPAVLGYGVAKVVVYPKLVDSNNQVRSASLLIDGVVAPLELASNMGIEIMREYDAMQPQIIGAAISRMIVRALAAEGARAAVTHGGGGSSGLGFLAAILTEAALVAADKPDTRSWMMLPEQIHVHRQRVEPGLHTIQVTLGPGQQGTLTREVELRDGGYAAVIITVPR